MPNWSRSSIFETSAGDTDAVPVSLKRDYRLPIPADVRRAVDWLKDAPPKRDVLFELNEPGRVRVLDLESALPRILEAVAADPDAAADFRLIYSRGNFIRDRLDLSDPAVPHLGILHEIGIDQSELVFVRAFAGDIEIWSKAFRDKQVERARERQRELIESLRRPIP